MELAKHEGNAPSVFTSGASFEHGQRIAKMLCASNIVPESYRGNMANTLVALEMANRIGTSPLMVMQNLHIIEGRPSWSSPFIISAINSCGRFAPLRYEVKALGKTKAYYWDGPKGQREKKQVEIDDYSCRAVTTDKEGNTIEGPAVTISMAVAEGWYSKSGSKWQTMPELMLRYRAAAFFGRLYAPDILMGMKTDDEVRDIQAEYIDAEHSVVNDAVGRVNEAVDRVNKAVAVQVLPEHEDAGSPATAEGSPATAEEWI